MASGTGIGEFFVSLTVDAAQGNLNVSNLVQTFGELEIATLAEIGLLWELGVGLARVVDAGVKASLGFEQFTMHTGLSAQELQKWQVIAAQSHASAEDVGGSVENLTKHLANLAVGIPDASLASLQQLGISAFGAGGKLKDAFEILGEVRQRLGVVSRDAGQQERILGGLGISPNLRETLLLTDALFRSRGGLVRGMTADQEKSFDDLRQTLVQIELLAKQIGLDIGAWVAPFAKGVFKTELEALKTIRDWLEGGNKDQGDVRGWRTKQAAEEARERTFLYSLFNPNPRDLTARDQLATLLPKLFGGTAGPPLPPEPPGGFRQAAPAAVHIDKHDTYNIETNDPDAVKAVIEKHWDDILGRKTVDGFDRQLNNGGY